MVTKIITFPASEEKEPGDLYQSATGEWFVLGVAGMWGNYDKPVPAELADEYKASGQKIDYVHGCGYTNITAKHPCGGCSAMPWLNVPHEPKPKAGIGDVGYCMHCGYTANWTVDKPCGSCGQHPWNTKEVVKYSVTETENTYSLALNLKEDNSPPTTFMKNESGDALVPTSVLQSCADNLDRLRAQRNTYRKQYQELSAATRTPGGGRKAMANHLFRQYDQWLNKRKTILDGGQDLSKKSIAQRKRHSNEKAAELLREYAHVLFNVGIEELLADPDD